MKRKGTPQKASQKRKYHIQPQKISNNMTDKDAEEVCEKGGIPDAKMVFSTRIEEVALERGKIL